MTHVRIFDKLMIALALTVLTVSAAQALTVRGTPVTVMNTAPDGGSIPVTGNVGVAGPVTVNGSVNVTNTVPVMGNVGVSGNVTVSGTTDVNVTNTTPLKVKPSEPKIAKIQVQFIANDPETQAISNDITLPGPAVLEWIGFRCSEKVDHVGIISWTDGSGVTVSNSGNTSSQLIASHVYWKLVPLTDIFGDYFLPLTQVALPLDTSYLNVVIGRFAPSTNSINCTGTFVVRYVQ